MRTFASGAKRHYYGKCDVIAFRLRRAGGSSHDAPVFGVNVSMLVYGNAFWRTYTHGDNRGVIATDSMKNFIQRETLGFDGAGLEEYCRYVGEKFLAAYQQVEGLQITATEIPFSPIGPGVAFVPAGPERAGARLELTRAGFCDGGSSMSGFRLLRLGGSAFRGFVRDEYTTLHDADNRPLHMWLDVEWRYHAPDGVFSDGRVAGLVRATVHDVFVRVESESIQQLVYRMSREILMAAPGVSEVTLEAANRTWDTIAESGDALGVYTEARPPYGCIGLTLGRDDL